MEVRSITRMARISAFKGREVTRLIQGLPVGEALDVLRFTPKKAARLVSKTLASAIANAENNNGLSADLLYVKEAVMNEGASFRRFKASARGMASPRQKRTAHIRIIVAERPEAPAKAKKKNAKPARAKKPVAEAQESKPE